MSDSKSMLVVRRDGSCPLQYNIIRMILEWIHDDLRFTLNKHGLGSDNEVIPNKLNIHAILNARLMDTFETVLLGDMFRTKTWPLVESDATFIDIVPWLKENRCPYIYNVATLKTANVYGIIMRTNDDGVLLFTYEGDFKDGLGEGHGKLIHENGDVYEGDFKKGKGHGHGNKKCANGDVYEGDFKEGKKHGHGKFIHANGIVYEGDFKEGNMHGHGKRAYDDGEVYIGGFKDNTFNGHGKFIYANGTVYNSYWLDGIDQRHGSQIWPNGDFYFGHFDIVDNDDDVSNCLSNRHGNGICTYANGSIYNGDWINDNRHGFGHQTWPDGRIYSGEWKDDVFHGEGRYTKPDGLVYEGRFENGCYVNLNVILINRY